MKKIVKPFQQQSRYTTMDNFIIDQVMPKLSGSAWKVLTVIIRKTIGWHKECDEVSFRQLLTLTGIKSFATLTNALKELEVKKIIKVDRGDGKGITFIYALNLDFELEVKEAVTESVTDKSSVTESVTPTVTKTVTLPKKGVTDSVTTKEIENLNKESKRGGGKPAPLPIPISIKAYQEINNRYPNKATWEMIAQTVGETPKAIDFWKKVIVTWIGCDFNPRNISGMLDCFKRNELPTTKKKEVTNGQGKYGSPTPGDRPKQTEREAAATDAAKSRIRSISRTGGHSPQPEVRPLRPILDPDSPT